MSQRYVLYYLLARIVLALLTIFVFPEPWFRGFIQSYWWYLIFVSISYFTYCYYLHEEQKIYFYIRNVLLIFNIYLTLHVFFRPLLNIEPSLFVLLGCILWGLRYLSKLHIKIKRPFYLIGETLCFLILISGNFYLYPEAPNIDEFIIQQHPQLILTSPTTQAKYTAYISLIDHSTNKQQILLFQTGTQLFSLPQTYQISYIATTTELPSQTFLLSSNGELFQLSPQSTVSFQEKIIPEQGTFLQHGTLRTGRATTTNRIEESATILPLEIDWDTYQNITSSYRNSFQSHLTEQIGSPFLTNPMIQRINTKVLSLLSKTFPWFFAQNLKNYQQFSYYFSLFNQSTPLLNTEKYSTANTLNTKETNIFQQLKNNIQLSLPNLNFF
jgi:hypothetical protein